MKRRYQHINGNKNPVFAGVLTMERLKNQQYTERDCRMQINQSTALYVQNVLAISRFKVDEFGKPDGRYLVKNSRFIRTVEFFSYRDSEDIQWYGLDIKFKAAPENTAGFLRDDGSYEFKSFRQNAIFRFSLDGKDSFDFVWYPNGIKGLAPPTGMIYDSGRRYHESEILVNEVARQRMVMYNGEFSFNPIDWYELVDYALCEVSRSNPRKIPNYRNFVKEFSKKTRGR